MNAQKRIATSYNSAFASLAGGIRPRLDGENQIPFCYTLRVLGDRRDAFLRHMKKHGIGVSIQYIPNHLQPAFAAYRVPLPVTERLAEEYVSIPLFAGMTDEQIDEVISWCRLILRITSCISGRLPFGGYDSACDGVAARTVSLVYEVQRHEVEAKTKCVFGNNENN